MKINNINIIVANGEFISSEAYQVILSELKDAIKSVVWASPDKFVINPMKKGNGVVPIKNNFIKFFTIKRMVSGGKNELC